MITAACAFLLGLLVGLAFLCFLRGADTRGTEEALLDAHKAIWPKPRHITPEEQEWLRKWNQSAKDSVERTERLYDRQGIL